MSISLTTEKLIFSTFLQLGNNVESSYSQCCCLIKLPRGQSSSCCGALVKAFSPSRKALSPCLEHPKPLNKKECKKVFAYARKLAKTRAVELEMTLGVMGRAPFADDKEFLVQGRAGYAFSRNGLIKFIFRLKRKPTKKSSPPRKRRKKRLTKASAKHIANQRGK